MSRRAQEKLRAKKRAEKEAWAKAPPARRDGRPLYFDIQPGEAGECWVCQRNGLKDIIHKYGSLHQSDPVNPPPGGEKGVSYDVCTHHLPDNAVIYHPPTGLCRNKAADKTWREE